MLFCVFVCLALCLCLCFALLQLLYSLFSPICSSSNNIQQKQSLPYIQYNFLFVWFLFSRYPIFLCVFCICKIYNVIQFFSLCKTTDTRRLILNILHSFLLIFFRSVFLYFFFVVFFFCRCFVFSFFLVLGLFTFLTNLLHRFPCAYIVGKEFALRLLSLA